MNVTQILDAFSALSTFGRLVVAGGAVRDELMGRTPKDYDLFLLGADPEEARAKVPAIVAKIAQPFEVEWHDYEPYLLVQARLNGDVVQVMWHPTDTVDDLLDSFDWSVSLFAHDGAVHARESVDNIAPGKYLRLQRMTYPVSNLRRGFRFSERFRMKVHKEDILTLCQGVIDKQAKKSANGAEPDMPALAAVVEAP